MFLTSPLKPKGSVLGGSVPASYLLSNCPEHSDSVALRSDPAHQLTSQDLRPERPAAPFAWTEGFPRLEIQHYNRDSPGQTGRSCSPHLGGLAGWDPGPNLWAGVAGLLAKMRSPQSAWAQVISSYLNEQHTHLRVSPQSS